MKKYIVLLIGSLLLFSCRDYLDVVPKGYLIPTTVNEYGLLLVGGDNGPNRTSNEQILHYSNDNFYLTSTEVGNISNPLNTNYALYAWTDFRYSDPTVPNPAWNSAYRNIYTFNKIIDEIDGATLAAGDTEEQRKKIKAQAYYGRAYQYLFLVNTFSKQYKESSAGSDLGVPLVLKADVTQTLPSRGTVSSVYAQIISDLNGAIQNLPTASDLKLLPTKGAGYALLARTNLYKGDYENAKKYAQLALDQNSTLLDYTDPGFTNDNLSIKINEQYATHYMNQPSNGFLSDDAVSIFNEDGTDQRLTEQFIANPIIVDGEVVGFRYQMGSYDYNFNGTTSVSIPEMFVTLAEAESRLGNSGAAIDWLNQLRDKRIFGNEHLTMADFASASALTKFCLEERRREMIYTNTRLFDLKRENLEPTFAKVTIHKVLGTTPITFTAEPNSRKLILPISAQVLKFNPGMPQN